MSAPLVSVVIPHYEAEKYLSEAINSVLQQTYDNVEVVVVDSSHLINPPFVSDERVRYIPEEPNGVSAALNTGIEASNGEFVNLLGADDFLVPTKLSIQASFLQNSEFDIVYADEYLITDNETKYIRSLPISNQKNHYVKFFKSWGGVQARAPLISSKCFENERFDTSLEINEDYHLWVRLFKEYKIGRISEALSYKRDLEDSLSSDLELSYQEGLHAIRDLLQQYPELREHKNDCLFSYHSRFAQQFLSSGEPEKTITAAKRALMYKQTNPKIYILGGIAAAPVSTDLKVQYLESLREIKSLLT